MPDYRYETKSEKSACKDCLSIIEAVQSINDKPMEHCPECGDLIRKVPVTASVGHSQSSFDDRAKAAGFSKLKKLGKGEYEKQY